MKTDFAVSRWFLCCNSSLYVGGIVCGVCFVIIAYKAVSYIINSRALTGKKPCINKAIHALLMHGYAAFNMILPGPQICCSYGMCSARP